MPTTKSGGGRRSSPSRTRRKEQVSAEKPLRAALSNVARSRLPLRACSAAYVSSVSVRTPNALSTSAGKNKLRHTKGASPLERNARPLASSIACSFIFT